MKKAIIYTFLIFTLLIACSGKSAIQEDGLYAVVNTSKGKFTCELYYEQAPITVANFVGLSEGKIEFTDPKTKGQVKRKYYDGLIFHRIVKDFVLQGGDPLGTGMGTPGYEFPDEFHEDLRHDSAGIMSMANRGPNTNGSQFFVTLNPTPHLDGKHAIFGKVIDGMETILKISEVKIDKRSKPFKDVYIKSIKIVRVGDDAKDFDVVEAFTKKNELMEKLEQEKTEKRKALLKKLGVIESKIITTEIGLQYYVKRSGTGAMPKKGQTIVAHYAGYLEDGTSFDSSYDRNKPFEVPIGVGRVIEGWDKAFLTMREGEKRILILPYYLAYGERGNPPVIPAKATLIFDVELIRIK